MDQFDYTALESVTAELAYVAELDAPAQIQVYPPSSNRQTTRLPRQRVAMPIYDCRPLAKDLTLDGAGFELRAKPTAFADFYNAARVEREYYPEVEALLMEATGALRVFIFDHNVRSQVRSTQGQLGVREPVDGAHNDYTLSSGPRRVREILANHDALDLANHRAALINVWRPIVGPVQDFPLAVCDATSTHLEDFIPTEIQHFLEDDLQTPHLIGEVYSFQHSPQHRWFYVSNMQPDEVMLLKCFDSADDGRACFTGHTGFRNPACPAEFIPRESIEARTVVVFPEDEEHPS